jgi:hypothetical protein
MKRVTPLFGGALIAMAIVSTAFGARAGDHERRGSEAAPDFELPAVQLRIALGRVLGEHAFLVIEAMRTSPDTGPEFNAAGAALDENTAEIEALIAGVLSETGARAFGEQWRNHVAYLLDYARAVTAGDTDAQDLAAEQLAAYSEEFSALLLEAFPNLPAHAVEALVGEHVSQLEQVGNLAQGDYEAAYSAIRDTYAHMFMIGDSLTIGITGRSGNEFEGRETALSPAVDLRMTLDRLLGEHTYLAAIVMRARVAGDANRNAAAAALNLNSQELADQIATIYGDEAGAAFQDLWTRHTTLYVEYVDATAAGDDARQDEVLSGLATYRSDFSAFLAEANPLLDADELEALLEVHTQHLVDQVAAYAGGEYDHAFAMLRDAYAQTEDLSTGLAGAIADQFPQLFPDTASTMPPPGGPLRQWAAVIGVAMCAYVAIMMIGRWRRSAEVRGRGTGADG